MLEALTAIGSEASDRYITITNSTWEDFENLHPNNCLVSYRNGIITIVSPGRNHERIADLLRAVIWGYCWNHKLSLHPFNQTRLKEEGKEGKEPDVAYCIGEDKSKPDLAIEVNLSSGSIDDLTKYQYLKVTEVWLWESDRLSFYIRSESGYQIASQSEVCHGLAADTVAKIVNQYRQGDVLEVFQIATQLGDRSD